jgi:hypothetical protein
MPVMGFKYYDPSHCQYLYYYGKQNAAAAAAPAAAESGLASVGVRLGRRWARPLTRSRLPPGTAGQLLISKLTVSDYVAPNQLRLFNVRP